MKILIVGSDANAYLLARKFSKSKEVNGVFVLGNNSHIEGFAEKVNIDEFDFDLLINFVKDKDINLTIVTSENAILNGIADEFNSEKLHIFAPTMDAARVATSKASGKKVLYKLKVKTPKFGIFDRENAAVDYIRRAKYPLVLKNDVHKEYQVPVVCTTFPKAKLAVEKFFEAFNKKLVIEDYIDAKYFTTYFVTDGYTAFPIGSVCSKKNYDNGFETKFVNLKSVFSPEYYVSAELESKLMSRVVYPLLDEIAKQSAPYVGILGVDVILSGSNFQVSEFNPFFKITDLQAIYPLIKNNLLEVFSAATVGSLSDDYSRIDFNENFAFSVELATNKKLNKDDGINISYSDSNRVVVTSWAATLNSAKNILRDYLEAHFDFDKEFSPDIFNVVKEGIIDE